MIRFFLFSLIFLMPLGANCKNADPVCPKNASYCQSLGRCIPPDTNCPSNIVLLKKKKDSIYSLAEGAVVTCEEGKTLTPLPGSTTHWTCGTPEGTPGRK